ncbi:MAG: type IV secretion system DNA-binding domain-containing protein, partial [Geminicoccaceae bacterium]
LDQRSADWSPWSEIRKASDCTAIAEAFIPKGIERDPFWGNAGRLLYAEVLDRLRNDPDRSIERLLHILLRMSQEEVRDILKGTNAAKLFEEGAERTGKSVEIHNSIYIKALGLLRADAGREPGFSIYDYVQTLDRPAPEQGRPWLWLTTDPRSSPILKPLLSCWTNAVATALVSLPEREDRRLWFVLDELATLHELPSLPDFMQNGRKRGGCAVITLQTPSQLSVSYDKPAADTILNGCQTQAIFRVTDPEGSEWASRSFSDVEIEEMQESARLNTQGGRGHEVNLSVQKRISRVVLPGEIAMQKNCHCYVKLPEDWSISKTVVTPRSPLSGADLTPGFIERSDFSETAGDVLARLSSKPTSAPCAPATPPAVVNGAANGEAESAKKPTAKPASSKRKGAKPSPCKPNQLSLGSILDEHGNGRPPADPSKRGPLSTDEWGGRE